MGNLGMEFDQQQLKSLYNLAIVLSSLPDVDSVMTMALEHCLSLTHSQFGFIGLVDDGGAVMDVVSTVGFHPGAAFHAKYHIIPLRPNIFSYVIVENEPIRSADTRIDSRRAGQPDGHPPVETFLGVPLRVNGKPIGMLGVANRPQPYTEAHEQLLMTYAAPIAICICNSQLVTQLEQTVAQRTYQLNEARQQLRHLLSETVNVEEKERKRIAQGLHDGINQLLVGGSLQIESARRRLAHGHLDTADQALLSVQTIISQVANEVRHIIYDLRPPTLDEFGLAAALDRQAAQFKRYTKIDCHVYTQGDLIRLPARREISIYRLVQEALQNAHIHANPTYVQIDLIFGDDTVAVSVYDDGDGFDLNAIQQERHGHFGLMGMQERADALDGVLSIDSNKGSGTRVMLVIPVGVYDGENQSVSG